MTMASHEGFRLFAAQRRLWFLAQQGAARSLCAVDISGEILPETLQGAVGATVERHESLRTAFVRPIGMKVPVQQIAASCEIDWWQDYLSSLDGPELRSRLDALAAREAVWPIDLERGPRVRVGLISTGPGRAVLLLNLPSLCADSASLRRLVEEVAAISAGSELPEPLQYLDIADWQAELLEAGGDEAEQGRAYWSRQAAAAARPPHLPFELTIGGEPPSVASALAVLPVEAGVLSRIAQVAGKHEVSRGDVLRAAWWALLGRLGGSFGVSVSEIFEGRDGEQLKTGVGPIARWIPLQAEVDESSRFSWLVQRLSRARSEAEKWQLYFMGPKENEPAALAVGFDLTTWPTIRSAAGVSFAVRWCRTFSEPLKLCLVCLDRQEDLLAEVLYEPSRLPAADVELLVQQLRTLLDCALADPELRIRELRLAGDEEIRRLLERFSHGGRQPLLEDGVHRRFESWAAQTPEAPALVSEGTQMLYRELNERANRLARALRRLGVGADIPVVLYLERSTDLVVGMLAILKAGGAYVPFDTSQPERRLAIMLEEVPVPVIVTQASLKPRLPQGTAFVLSVDEDREMVDRESDENLVGGLLPESLAYIIFTSGSTGRPKGVGVEHRHLVNYVEGVRTRLDLQPGWSYASVSTFAADLGHTSIFSAFTTGGCLHLISQERASDPAAMEEYFERHQVDCLKIVPTHFEALQVSSHPEGPMPRRRLIVGGEASKGAWGEELARLAGECRVFNHYGPTETTVGVLTYPVSGTVDPRCATLPIGRPIPNTSIYVLDPAGRPVSLWEPGELHIGGASVCRGYHSRPDLTAEKFVPDPFGSEPGMRLYRTGDLVRLLPNGQVEFRGRRDDQIKFHGFRVELNEIRSALSGHPQVRNSVVVASRDQNGRDLLVAYYVSRQEIEFGELRGWLAQTLIEEVIPNVFVHLRKLPLTLNGKINYRALPDFEEIRKKVSQVFVAPRTATEALVADVWSQVLGLERVSAEANFFELGGHSLLATRIISRLQESFGELPLRAIFENPTVASISRAIDARYESGAMASGVTFVQDSQSIEDQLAELETLPDEELKTFDPGGQERLRE